MPRETSIVVMAEDSADQWLIPFYNPGDLHLWDLITIGRKEYIVTMRKWAQSIGGPHKLIFYVKEHKEKRVEVNRG